MYFMLIAVCLYYDLPVLKRLFVFELVVKIKKRNNCHKIWFKFPGQIKS